MAQCPNCGDRLSDAFSGALMMACGSCGTLLYLRDDRMLQAGSAGVMQDAPLLVALGDTVQWSGQARTAYGHARYSYGPGWWDEFWLVDEGGGDESLWLSIDEGDIAWQRPVDASFVSGPQRPTLGDTVSIGRRDYTVTEENEAVCIALRGSFPEPLALGETYRYANLTGAASGLASAEMQGGQTHWFVGAWIDPFDVKVTRS